jgi:hypothetical protein
MTLQEIKDMYKEVFYLEDDMILDIICATAISTKLRCDPVWLLIIGGSSSGKSELINTLNKVQFNHPISSMTENTFLSNMRTSDGKEASLLHRIGVNGMITMKDYTSILAMRNEKRELIVSQMREIYDGKLDKEAGNGNPQHWEGKINWIGAVTDSVYLKEDESAGMGRRTINYIMPQQDRKKTTKAARLNNADIGEKRDRLQSVFSEYIMQMIESMEGVLPDIDDELADELVNLADFTTISRTPTERNYRGELILVPDAEMPMRVFHMFQTFAKVLAFMNGGTISEDQKRILYKLAMDSIPKQRMLTLRVLTKYKSVTTKGAAQELRYPTETMRTWLENVNVLGICEREAAGVATPDIWTLNEEYRQIMTKYSNVKVEETTLADANEITPGDLVNPVWARRAPLTADLTDDKGKAREIQEATQRAFDAF